MVEREPDCRNHCRNYIHIYMNAKDAMIKKVRWLKPPWCTVAVGHWYVTLLQAHLGKHHGHHSRAGHQLGGNTLYPILPFKTASQVLWNRVCGSMAPQKGSDQPTELISEMRLKFGMQIFWLSLSHVTGVRKEMTWEWRICRRQRILKCNCYQSGTLSQSHRTP